MTKVLGNCAGQDVEIFYPTGKTGRVADGAPARDRDAQEKMVAIEWCTDCSVKDACLSACIFYYHLTGKEQEGVWGGTTQIERKKILDKLR